MLDPDRPLADIDFVAFDLETTSLYPAACRIVEFGAVRFRLEGPELDAFDQLVDPQCEIPLRVSQIHGITDDLVRGQPTEAEILPRFFAFLNPADTVLLAHNASFDLGFLTFAAARQQLCLPTGPIVDTLELARGCVRGCRSFRLEDLASHLRVAAAAQHRALADCRLVMGVVRKILALSGRLRTVGDLFAAAAPLAQNSTRAALPAIPPEYAALQAAIPNQKTVRISYEFGLQALATRSVTPRGIVQSHGRGYLVAFCHADRIEKTYRLDRIHGYHVLDG